MIFLLPNPEVVCIAGLKDVYYLLEDGKLNFDLFQQKINGCAAVVENSPSNPLGSTLSDETFLEIESLGSKEGYYLIFDEIYRQLSTKDFFSLRYEKTIIIINSFSKTFCMCGIRVGCFYTKDKA